MTQITNRYDFALLFDVENGNPNGDPDAGNLPRIDHETNRGLVTDVCLKRKVRNYIEMLNRDNAAIYIREKAVLARLHKEAFEACATDEFTGGEADETEENKNKKAKGRSGEQMDAARRWMCERYFDVRTFGAVMVSSTDNCGQVRGPVQMTFAHSIDPVLIQEHSITRMAVTNENDANKERTMGRKNTIPYGLYIGYGFVSAHLAAQTGFSVGDLELFWEALVGMFEHDHSAARGIMSTRKLYIFKHDSALGNAPARSLFDLIKVERKDNSKPARCFEDYTVTLDETGIPSGVSLLAKP